MDVDAIPYGVDFRQHVEAFAFFEGYATEAPNPRLREAAVDAMGYRAWPEFRPLLERIAAQDTDENVRRHAQEILPFVPHSPGN